MEHFSWRKNIIIAIMLLIGLIFVIRLLLLQVIDKSYELSAESNTRRLEIVYPARGLIYDRTNTLLVSNQPSYDLKIAPYELEAFDTTLLCDILGIEKEMLIKGIKRVKRYASARREPFIKQISPEVFARLKENQFKFPGFYFTLRTLRNYSFKSSSHLLGYVGEVDSSVIKRDNYYELGDYYGVSGVEKTYEEYLRGSKGVRYRTIDVRGREVGAYKEGRYDEDAAAGKNLHLTIDQKLQLYGEELMDGYKGSIVAIEPKTGEILAYISSPGYDPSLLVGRERISNYRHLQLDTLKPLYNNAIMAMYPPGSTFKTVNGLIGLQEKAIHDYSRFKCLNGFYYTRTKKVGCHSHESPLEFVPALQTSCNAYFCYTYKRILEDPDFGSVADAYSNWRRHLESFGFANKLGIDLPYEKRGFIPRTDYYDRYYGKGYWRASTIISNAIGQGEILTTPLQIANLAATIANRGYYVKPHVVKAIEGFDTINHTYTEKNWTTIDTSYFSFIVEGMYKAINEKHGTALIARHRDITICGKTGTAQNPHGDDHSVFMAFAPMDDPEIAISVYVEHGEWGASYAAPIASLMIEKYLTDTIAPYRKWVEKRMMDGDLMHKESE